MDKMWGITKSSTKDVFRLALPAVGEMILYMIIWVFDTMMVGKYGGQVTVSAVGLGSEIIYTFVNMFIGVGLSVGVTSIIARRYGARKYEEAEAFSDIGFAIGIRVALCVSIMLFLLARPLYTIAGATPEVTRLGVEYMKICSFGIFFNMLMNVLNGIVRGTGNTKPPLVASLIINIVNIGLDAVLIFGLWIFPELGVKGAALATSIAHICGFCFMVWYIRKRSKIKCNFKNIKWDKAKVRELVKLSIPSGLQEGAFSICRLLNTLMIMLLGTIAFSANQITTTIEGLSFMPGYGFAVAATTLVGHKVGEGDREKAESYAHTSVFLGVVMMGICAVLFLLFPEFIISQFIKKEEIEVIEIGAMCLRLAALEQVPMAISMILAGSLKGAGDTRTPFIVAVISNWLIRLPLMVLFVWYLRKPVTYVWGITAIQWTIDAMLMYWLYRKKLEKNDKI
ncbi:MAG: MATE family efflux transporter [Tissierellales bacterium]|jgi:putative MATE family efflux protein|nr:MATE family efflux transporter [Tissierellales bacterium]